MDRETGRILVRTAGAAAAGVMLAAALAGRRRPSFDWTDKVVLITGGSRGLGLVLARHLVMRGAQVAICARDRMELAAARSDLSQYDGNGVFAMTCDVTDEGGVRSLVRTVQQRLGPIDVLINNAGVITVGPSQTMTRDDYEQAMATHFWAPLYTMAAVLPTMRRRKSGRIVNICSIGGKVAVPHLLPYCASKFALAGLSEGMRQEHYRSGIRVTTVYPWIMQTGGPLNSTFKGKHRREYALFLLASSMPGLVIDPDTAARRIIRATESGRAELVLGSAAKLARALHGVSPGVWMWMMGEVNRLLPKAGGIGTAPALGAQSESGIAPSMLTRPVYRAALRNNQYSSSRVRAVKGEVAQDSASS